MESGELGVNTREEAVGSVSREWSLSLERKESRGFRSKKRSAWISSHLEERAGKESRQKEEGMLTCLLLVFVQLFEKESTSGTVQVLRVVGSVSRYQ